MSNETVGAPRPWFQNSDGPAARACPVGSAGAIRPIHPAALEAATALVSRAASADAAALFRTIVELRRDSPDDVLHETHLAAFLAGFGPDEAEAEDQIRSADRAFEDAFGTRLVLEEHLSAGSGGAASSSPRNWPRSSTASLRPPRRRPGVRCSTRRRRSGSPSSPPPCAPGAAITSRCALRALATGPWPTSPSASAKRASTSSPSTFQNVRRWRCCAASCTADLQQRRWWSTATSSPPSPTNAKRKPSGTRPPIGTRPNRRCGCGLRQGAPAGARRNAQYLRVARAAPGDPAPGSRVDRRRTDRPRHPRRRMSLSTLLEASPRLGSAGARRLLAAAGDPRDAPRTRRPGRGRRHGSGT